MLMLEREIQGTHWHVADNRLSLIFDEGKYQPTVWGYEI